jgi:NAD(P)H dehydrogenase (quinone)
MILVTGVTGHLGKLTIDFLLTELPASSIAALVRNTTKSEPEGHRRRAPYC